MEAVPEVSPESLCRNGVRPLGPRLPKLDPMRVHVFEGHLAALIDRMPRNGLANGIRRRMIARLKAGIVGDFVQAPPAAVDAGFLKNFEIKRSV